MKKRINSTNSQQKTEKTLPLAVQLEPKRDKNILTHKHHNHCPLPKAPRKDSSKRKKTQEEAEVIKQLKTPILHELRHLASNLINSADRIAHFLHEQPHQCSLEIYSQDRKKLVQYLNSLTVRPISLNQVKAQLQKVKKEEQPVASCNKLESTHDGPVEEYLCREVEHIKTQINNAIHRKRSKSSAAHLHLEKEVSFVKDKLGELEKKNDQTRDEEFTSSVKLCKKLNSIDKSESPNNPESSEHLGGELEALRSQLTHQQSRNEQLTLKLVELNKEIVKAKNNLVYTELLLFKCEQLLNENLNHSEENGDFLTLDREKINLLLSTLRETSEYVRTQSDSSSSDLMQKLKQEAQSMVLYLSELRKKSLDLLREKEQALQSLRKERQSTQRDEVYCEQLKLKINRLNDEMDELLQEIDRKDELVDYLKIENANLKEDLKNMEDLIKQTKDNISLLGEELEAASDKLKHSECLLQSKDEHIHELLAELEHRNRQLTLRLEQLQAKQEDITTLKQEHARIEESRLKMIHTLNEEKKLLSLEKQMRENELKEAEGKLRFLEEESSILEKKIENVFNGEEEYKFRIDTLEEKVHSLEVENEQLYKDIREYEDGQESHEEVAVRLEEGYSQLQDECNVLRQEILQNHKRIRFYEQKVLELAELADVSYYERLLEDNEKQLAHLTQKLKHYENSSPILEENSDDSHETAQEENKHEKEENSVAICIHSPEEAPRGGVTPIASLEEDNLEKQLNQGEYYPFLHQDRSERSRKSSCELINYLKISKHEQFEPTISALSHYDIVVLNQNLDTIDTHKAVYPKSRKRQSEQLQTINVEQGISSNCADVSSSSHQAPLVLSSTSQQLHQENVQVESADEISENLSETSKKVNIDGEGGQKSQKMDVFNEYEVTPQVSAANHSRIPDLMTSQSSGENPAEVNRNPYLFKHVDEEQKLKAELRFSGEKANPSGIQSPTRVMRERAMSKRQSSSSHQSVEKPGTVYIRIRKQNAGKTSLGATRPRARSCYEQET